MNDHTNDGDGEDAPGLDQAGGDRTVIALIRDIQSGKVSGKSLAPADRRRVVEHLSCECYPVPEIAEILSVRERTITRDRQAIREANALHPNPSLLPQVAGHLSRHAELTIARCRRIAREKDVEPAVRLEAERAAWAVMREFVQTLQSLGYLPSGDRLPAHDDTGDDVGFDQIVSEAKRLARVAANGLDPSVNAMAQSIMVRIEAIALRDQVAALGARIGPGGEADHDTDN